MKRTKKLIIKNYYLVPQLVKLKKKNANLQKNNGKIVVSVTIPSHKISKKYNTDFELKK